MEWRSAVPTARPLIARCFSPRDKEVGPTCSPDWGGGVRRRPLPPHSGLSGHGKFFQGLAPLAIDGRPFGANNKAGFHEYECPLGLTTTVLFMNTSAPSIPSVSVKYAQDGSSTRSNALGMRPMQERAYQKRGEQYLLIKSPPASGKSRALMFIALDKLANQKLKQAIIVVPEKAIGASFHDEPLSQFGFWADWKVAPQWNLCDAPGTDNGGKVGAVKQFLESGDKVLVCTHATFRFAVEKFGVEAFDDRLIAVDEFHHVSANPDDRLVFSRRRRSRAPSGRRIEVRHRHLHLL
jgi:hypothetical protein